MILAFVTKRGSSDLGVALSTRPSRLRIERESRELRVLRLLNAGLIYETRI